MSYYKNVNEIKYKRLTRDEEKQLFMRMRAGDESARQQIIENFLPACLAIVRRIVGHTNAEELVAAANLGLIRAVDKYSPDSRACFLTYASFFIRGRVLESIRSSYKYAALLEKVGTIESRAGESGSRKQGFSGRANYSWSEAEVVRVSNWSDCVNPEPVFLRDNCDQVQLVLGIVQGSECKILDDTQKKVLQLCYLSGLDYASIGRTMKLSRERIRQIHNFSLTKIRKHLAGVAK